MARTVADVALFLSAIAGPHAQAAELFARVEYFILPVTHVVPFDVEVAYPAEIAGTPMMTHGDWLRSCWYVSFMSTPAISVPAGFTSSGLPVGIQIVGARAESGACSSWPTRSSWPRAMVRGGRLSCDGLALR